MCLYVLFVPLAQTQVNRSCFSNFIYLLTFFLFTVFIYLLIQLLVLIFFFLCDHAYLKGLQDGVGEEGGERDLGK